MFHTYSVAPGRTLTNGSWRAGFIRTPFVGDWRTVLSPWWLRLCFICFFWTLCLWHSRISRNHLMGVPVMQVLGRLCFHCLRLIVVIKENWVVFFFQCSSRISIYYSLFYTTSVSQSSQYWLQRTNVCRSGKIN